MVLVTLFLLSTLAGTQLIGNVSAAIPYTEYTGTLDGADWVLRIPDPWNGMLVVFCRGYSTDAGDPASMLGFWTSSILDSGFAVAASNFGSAGWNVKQGMSSSYELTMYVINNYDVAGKVFLYGVSMGGQIALMLGEKYPDVYSGVFDLYGVKDLKVSYTRYSTWATLTDEELEAELTAIGAPIPPFLYSSLEDLRSFYATAADNIEIETGGTPTTNPMAYEDISPTYHADIQIPVITLQGKADAIVLYAQSLLYQNAVAKAYCSDLYRLYGVTGGQHVSGDVQAEAPAHFNELVEWSNELTGAHDWPMYRQNLQHTGISTSNAPNTNQTLWMF